MCISVNGQLHYFAINKKFNLLISVPGSKEVPMTGESLATYIRRSLIYGIGAGSSNIALNLFDGGKAFFASAALDSLSSLIKAFMDTSIYSLWINSSFESIPAPR